MKIGITGNTGFIGTHLTDYLQKKGFEIVPFEKEYFLYQDKMDDFVKQSDVIIHLAGRSKPHDKETVYIDNIMLSLKLYSTIKDVKFKGHLIFVSSIHENKDNYYAKSKSKSREMLGAFGGKKEYKFTGLILPNVFGAGAKGYNSFITAFCKQLYAGWMPKIFKDVEIGLIYIDELVMEIFDVITKPRYSDYLQIHTTSEAKISYILSTLKMFNDGERMIKGKFEINLNTTWEENLTNWQS